MKQLKVFKFGGASVKDADGVKNVANILKDYVSQPLVIVVSAMGKTTDALEKVVNAHAHQSDNAQELLEAIKVKHRQLCEELFDKTNPVFDAINDIFVEIDWVLEEKPHENYDFMYDQIVPVGELVSTKIVAAYLNQAGIPTQWIDARDVVRTDNLYREAWVQWDETMANTNRIIQPLLDAGKFVLTQGFIGSTSENFTTTLGREGSDYTAAILSYCLNAESMTIWKDVPGVLTGDPRLFDNVTKLDRLSYKEAIEMTYYGAKVIHPKTIKPLQNKTIPLFVKSFLDPKGDGTCISAEAEDTYPPMVAVEKGQALLHISTRDFSFVAEHHMSNLFQKIAEMRLQVNMMQNTAISFVICVNDIDDRVERFSKAIERNFKVVVERDLELITVRHAHQDILENLTRGRIVLLEERIRNTVQMVVKNVPMMMLKTN